MRAIPIVFMSTCLFSCTAQAQVCGADERIGFAIIEMDLAGSEIEYVQAGAFAFALRIAQWDCNDPGTEVCHQKGGAGGTDSCFCPIASAWAVTHSTQYCDDAYRWEASAQSDIDSDEIQLITEVSTNPWCVGDCTTMTGVAAAIATAVVERESGVGSTVQLGGLLYLPEATGAEPGGRYFSFARLAVSGPSGTTTTLYSVIDTDLGTGTNGVSFDSGVGAWSGTVSGDFDPGDTLSIVIVSGPERHFDVDDDGRLNTGDVTALDAIVGTSAASDTDNVNMWDFDRSGVIDAADVDFLSDLLADGIDAGMFADADGDEDTDCDDYGIAVSDFVEDSVLGDGDYIVEFDYDLDGDNDEADWCELRAQLNPADFATPYGTLNYDDVLAFLALFGAEDPKADFATPYGTYNADDVLAYNTAFGNGCP